MTDKEKLEKLRAEIERLMSYCPEHGNFGEKILNFIDSMQENPCDGCTNKKGCVTCENGELRETAQEDPASKKVYKCPKCGGHMTLDMSAKTASVKPMYYLRCDNCRYLDFIDCDKVQKEDSVCKDYRNRYKRIAQSNAFKESYDSKSISVEKPVSEELEEAAKRYGTEGDEISGLYIIDEEVEAFKAGAKWQKQKMIKDAFEVPVVVPSVGERIPAVAFGMHGTNFKDGDKVKVIIIK